MMTSKAPNFTAQEEAQKVRAAYTHDQIERRIKANQAIIQADLVPMTVPNALPNDQGWESNLLHRDQLPQNLDIAIPSPWGRFPSEVTILLDYDEDNPIDFKEYPTAPVFPLKFSIPHGKFQREKTYEISYTVSVPGSTVPSPPTTFTVDLIDPCRNNNPRPLMLEKDHINREYLDDNKGLPFNILAFEHARPGDFATIYLKGPGDLAFSEVHRTAPRANVPQEDFDYSRVLFDVIPKAVFIDAEGNATYSDGTIEIYFVATSRAGNQSKPSSTIQAQLALSPEPKELKPAVIPLAAESTPLIDRQDAITGVTVRVPEYENWSPDDDILVYWGNRLSDQFKVGQAPDFPLESKAVSYTTLVGQGTSDDEGPKYVAVTYRVKRGAMEYSPASETTTSVDLRTPGPVNPDPGPENPALGTVTVRGGGSAPEDNKIKVDDIGFPVTVTLPLWKDPAPQAGDTLEVIWNGKATGVTYEIVGGEPAFSIEIPFSVVTEHGDGAAIPAQMSLTAGDTTIPGDNIPVTKATPVNVNTFVIGALTPPAFPDKDRWEAIGCDQRVWEGARLVVEGDAKNFSKDDLITIHWEGHVSKTDPTLIPDTKGQLPVTLTPEQATNGFEARIPFDNFITKTADADGYMYAWYELTKTTGQTAPSDEIYFLATYTTATGCHCTSEGACTIAPRSKARAKV